MKKQVEMFNEFKKANKRVQAAMARLSQGTTEARDANWAAVEEVRYLAAQLEQIADRLNGTGEYAKAAALVEMVKKGNRK